MLQSMRSAAGTWVIKILFVLLILSFGAWGITDYIGNIGAGAPALTVGEREISVDAVDQQLTRQLRQLEQRLGQNIPRQQAIRTGYLSLVVEQMAHEALLDVEAQNQGLAVSDTMLAQRIRSEEMFQTDGTFDRTIFDRFMRFNDISEAEYFDYMRGTTLRLSLLRAAVIGAFPPEPLVRHLVSHRQEKRIAETLYLPPESVGTVPPPDEAAIRTYYDDNSQAYQAPEYRQVSYIHIDVDLLARDVAINDEALRQEYDIRKHEFGDPEQRQIRQLVFPSKAAAQAHKDAIAAGGAFEDPQTEDGAMTPTVIDLGWVKRADLLDELKEPVFALEKGAVSDPLASPLGYHLMQVTDIKEGTLLGFDEVKEDLKLELGRRQAVDEAIEQANRLDDMLAEGKTLEEAADALGTEVHQVEAVDRSGLPPTQDGRTETVEPFDLPGGSQFLTNAFRLNSGETDFVTEIPEGGAFVVRVDHITPPKQRPLDAVKDLIIDTLTQEKRLAMLEAKGEALKAKLESGETTLAALAEDEGLERRKTPPFTRNQALPSQFLPDALVASLFAFTEPGGAAMAWLGNGIALGVLETIQPVELSDPAQESVLAQARKDLRRALSNDLEQQYLQALTEEIGIEVHSNVLARLGGEG